MTYVILTSSDLKEKCEKTLSWVRTRRHSAEREIVQARVDALNGWGHWYRRLLCMKKLSPDDVWPDGSEWSGAILSWDFEIRLCRTTLYLEHEFCANRLLKCARAGDPVHVSAEDLYLLRYD